MFVEFFSSWTEWYNNSFTILQCRQIFNYTIDALDLMTCYIWALLCLFKLQFFEQMVFRRKAEDRINGRSKITEQLYFMEVFLSVAITMLEF